MNKIDKKYKLVKTLILNGKIDRIPTGDDQGYSKGINLIINQKRINGSYSDVIIGYPLSMRIESEIKWEHKFANVRIIISDNQIKDPSENFEDYIKFISGAPSAERCLRYSELTGYLYTEEDFKVGGHDLIKILDLNFGKYIHMEIELFVDKEKKI